MTEQNQNLTIEEAEALEGQSSPDNMVFLTGDKHGDMGEVKKFCKRMELPQDSTVIILGDAGVNFFRDLRDKQRKDCLARLAPTIFCVHGNHEARPTEALGYHEAYYHGGKVMVQDAYPNILFPLDGEIFHFCGQSVLVIGGAYSVDKKLRLANGWPWFPDEQPSQEIKDKVEEVLEREGWEVDVVLSHTCPRRYVPTEAFISGIDQSAVDTSTEDWLDVIECQLKYKHWYCGHYHIEKKIDKLRFMFHDFDMFPCPELRG